jgi:hypothetical protein
MGEYSKSRKEAATNGEDELRIAPNELEGSRKKQHRFERWFHLSDSHVLSLNADAV